MATYKFENHKAEIIDPIIEVNRNSININDITKTASCEIILITPNGSRFAVDMLDMPRNGIGWDDSDLETMIANKLQEFLI